MTSGEWRRLRRRSGEKIWVKGGSTGGYSTYRRAVVRGTRRDGNKRYLLYEASGHRSDGTPLSWRGEKRLDLSWADDIRRRFE